MCTTVVVQDIYCIISPEIIEPNWYALGNGNL